MIKDMLAIIVLACSTVALAQDADIIVDLSPASRTTITVYESASRASPSTEVSKDQLLARPKVLAREKGFLKIDIDGRDMWVPSLQVRIRKDSVGSCGTLAASARPLQQAVQTGATIATPGIGKQACK